MDQVKIDITRYQTKEKKHRPNPFGDLCQFAADIYNAANPEKEPVTLKRFLKDCAKHRWAYQMAIIDFNESETRYGSAKEKAILYFGALKKRKGL